MTDNRETRIVASMYKAIKHFTLKEPHADQMDYLRAWVHGSIASLALPQNKVQAVFPWLKPPYTPAAGAIAISLVQRNDIDVAARLLRLYLPFMLPSPLPATAEAASRGDVGAATALEFWMEALGKVAEVAHERDPDGEAAPNDRRTSFLELLEEPWLTTWTRPQPTDVDLEPIRGYRGAATRASDSRLGEVDRQSRAAALRYACLVVDDAPHLLPRAPALVREGARIIASALADGAPQRIGVTGPAPAPPDVAGSYPTRLRTAEDWVDLSGWKNLGSRMILARLSDGDQVGAAAMIRHRDVLAEAGWSYFDGTATRLEDYRWLIGDQADLALWSAEEALERLTPKANSGSGLHGTKQPQAHSHKPVKQPGAGGAGKDALAPSPLAAALAQLDTLVGLDAVKEQVRQIAETADLKRRRKLAGLPDVPVSFHMLLLGNPGTGKTTVARIIADVLNKSGLLSKGHVTEVGPADLIAKYVGQTEAKTRAVIKRALGGVLLLDEAYGLAGDRRGSYGHEAVTVLVSEMENHRDDLVVLAAGYGSQMHEFLDVNPGLRGRFTYTLDFPDFSNEALVQVFLGFAGKAGLEIDEKARQALQRAVDRTPRGPGFANARAMRALFEQSFVRQAARLGHEPDSDIRQLVAADIPGGDSVRTRSDALDRLNSLVGLESVKGEVATLRNQARIARLRRQSGMPTEQAVGHMVFTGNPGTGKTTVAQLLGQILADIGALPTGKLLVADRSMLVGKYIGQTAGQTRKIFEQAIGGVLFIDEAYSLVPADSEKDFGQEAISTLLPLMEQHGDTTVVVFAGYTDEMDRMLDHNPGMRSRIATTIKFPDYTPEEMVDIVMLAADASQLIFTPAAAERLTSIMVELPRGAHFGNARTALRILSEIRKNQANRLAAFASRRALPHLRVIEVGDVPEVPGSNDAAGSPAFGFAP